MEEKKILNKLTHLYEPYDKLSMKSGDTPEPSPSYPMYANKVYPLWTGANNELYYTSDVKITAHKQNENNATIVSNELTPEGYWKVVYSEDVTAWQGYESASQGDFASWYEGLRKINWIPAFTVCTRNDFNNNYLCNYYNFSSLVDLETTKIICNKLNTKEPDGLHGVIVVNDAFDVNKVTTVKNMFNCTVGSGFTQYYAHIVLDTGNIRTDFITANCETYTVGKSFYVPDALVQEYKNGLSEELAALVFPITQLPDDVEWLKDELK